MTLEQAHKLLDEEYEKSERIKGHKVPESIRVGVALLRVAEIAKEDSTYFTYRKMEVD